MDPLLLNGIDAVKVQQGSTTTNKIASQTVKETSSSFNQALKSNTSNTINPETNAGLTRADNAAEVEKSLEKMIVGLMMKPMFAEFAEFTFGKGLEADVYSSLFSDAVADEIATGGSLGLAKYTQNLNLDGKPNK